jgi:hypothetical protein
MLSESQGNEKEVNDSEYEGYSSGCNWNYSFHNGFSRVSIHGGSTLISRDPDLVSP